jgi:chaperonin GroES
MLTQNTTMEFDRGQVLGWRPKGDQLLVRPLITADRTDGGLFIPDEARERPQRGIVLAVGPGLAAELTGQLVAPQSQVGDLVLFGKYAGMTEDLGDGQEVIIMRDQEALAAKPAGSFTLVEHVDARGRRHIHEEGMACEHCPGVDLEQLRQAAGFTPAGAADEPPLITLD